MKSYSDGPQSLLLALIGTYFGSQRRPIPSAFLVKALKEFGLTETAARNGLSRVAKRGFLQLVKPGRQTYYSLTEMAHSRHATRLAEIVGFNGPGYDWDGRWCIVLFSVPEDKRALRHRARHELGNLRFGMLYDGVWIRPAMLDEDDIAALHRITDLRLSVVQPANFASHMSGGDPLSAFALDDLRSGYRKFAASAEALLDALDSRHLEPREALLERTRLVHEWRGLIDADPRLPAVLLPADWPFLAARQRFLQVYDGYAEPAEQHLRALLAEFSPELADSVRSPSSAEILGT